ncbi:F-box only protein 21 [Hondaea fermentalgiana]|uniref:F-box only protein 21 n=1 Tax=Hondaea fermentalgiana TaxID=2315210 RepID=A0A2R5G2M2_9STRA|nr:F-box only protein 21 [Hondaea fermentalgiana]|eukprot:GBG23978.1 F-box only protein 21 [Hondaea fermentalgiana]
MMATPLAAVLSLQQFYAHDIVDVDLGAWARAALGALASPAAAVQAAVAAGGAASGFWEQFAAGAGLGQQEVQEEFVDDMPLVSDLVFSVRGYGQPIKEIRASKDVNALEAITKLLASETGEFVLVNGDVHLRDGSVGLLLRVVSGSYEKVDAVVAAVEQVAVVYLEEVRETSRGIGVGRAVLLPEEWARPFRRGVVVEHLDDGFRGVVVQVHPFCRASDEWVDVNAAYDLRAGLEQPYYAILVDEKDANLVSDTAWLEGREGIAYASHEELAVLRPIGAHRVNHPRMKEFFSTIEDNRYKPIA